MPYFFSQRWICIRSLPSSRPTAATLPWWRSRSARSSARRARAPRAGAGLAGRAVVALGASRCGDRDAAALLVAVLLHALGDVLGEVLGVERRAAA